MGYAMHDFVVGRDANNVRESSVTQKRRIGAKCLEFFLAKCRYFFAGHAWLHHLRKLLKDRSQHLAAFAHVRSFFRGLYTSEHATSSASMRSCTCPTVPVPSIWAIRTRLLLRKSRIG